MLLPVMTETPPVWRRSANSRPLHPNPHLACGEGKLGERRGPSGAIPNKSSFRSEQSSSGLTEVEDMHGKQLRIAFGLKKTKKQIKQNQPNKQQH